MIAFRIEDEFVRWNGFSRFFTSDSGGASGGSCEILMEAGTEWFNAFNGS